VKARQRLEALRRENPSFQPWLALLEIALEAAGDATWEASARETRLAAPAGGPALEGAVIPVDGRAAARLLERLIGAASGETRAAARAVELDPARWLSAALGPEPSLLGSSVELLAVADLMAWPLLMACGRRLADRCAGWNQGSCPICGAWPTLAELRGLDRSRRLRCGRCGADWGLDVLRCSFCDNRDHERQRALVPEKGGESRRVDACDVCHGYLKALAQLGPLAPELIPLEDLASVELDLAAIDRDYRRPETPARRLMARVEV